METQLEQPEVSESLINELVAKITEQQAKVQTQIDTKSKETFDGEPVIDRCQYRGMKNNKPMFKGFKRSYNGAGVTQKWADKLEANGRDKIYKVTIHKAKSGNVGYAVRLGRKKFVYGGKIQ